MRASSHLPGSVGLRRIVRVTVLLANQPPFLFRLGGVARAGFGVQSPPALLRVTGSPASVAAARLLPVSNGALGANVRGSPADQAL